MTMHIKDAGVWKEVDVPSVKDAGVWKEVQEGWVKVSDVWTKFYQRVLVNIVNAFASAFSISPANAAAAVELTSSGLQRTVSNGSTTNVGTWLLSGAASDYEVRATVTAGALTTGTTGTWQSLSSSRSWSVSTGGIGSESATFDLEIRLAASPFTVLDSCTCQITADTEI